MIWTRSWRADPVSREIADRHYNRQKIGAPQFVPPGRCVVLRADREPIGRALWVTSWPFAEYVMHEWAGAWVCSIFRNENAGLASDLIRDALAATRYDFGDPPALGMITFVDRKKVKPYITPKGRVIFGQCYRQAGFRECGETKGGLLAFNILPSEMPPAAAPRSTFQPSFLE